MCSGADLREIQKQLDHLHNKSCPDHVFTFLALRRDVMFLEFETAVKFNLRDTFLGMGNKHAFNVSAHVALFWLELSSYLHVCFM